MFRYIVLILFFIIVGCVLQSIASGHGLTWKHKPYNGVIFLNVQSPQDIQFGWEGRPGATIKQKKMKVGGWARWWKQSNICQIYVPPLNDDRSYKIWRHELRHCQEGRFHKKSKE